MVEDNIDLKLKAALHGLKIKIAWKEDVKDEIAKFTQYLDELKSRNIIIEELDTEYVHKVDTAKQLAKLKHMIASVDKWLYPSSSTKPKSLTGNATRIIERLREVLKNGPMPEKEVRTRLNDLTTQWRANNYMDIIEIKNGIVSLKK